jgi:PAS domain S-box-containing protein
MVFGMGSESIIVRAIDQAPEAIVIADSMGRITYANEAVARLAGLSDERMRGRHFSSLIGEGLAIGDLEEIGARVAAGHTWSGPLMSRREDGSQLHVELIVSSVRNEAGEVTHSIAQLRDVTRERDLADVLTRELRQQVSIGAALSRLDPTEPIGVLAGNVASALIALDGVSFARVVALGSRQHGQVLADRSRGVALPRQLVVPPARTRHLLARAAQGPWVEAWIARREYGRYGRELKAAGVRAVGFAPLRHGGRPVGVMAIGSVEPRGVQVLERHLSALSHFGELASGLLGPTLAAHQHDADLRAEIERMIGERAFTPVFQPIVRLADGKPIAYEALTRFADGNPPERRFADADSIGLGVELESVTIRAALDASCALPSDAKLSINVSPRFVLTPGAMAAVLEKASRAIVLEITEQEAIEDYAAFRKAIAGLGVAVDWAVDDAGAGYASLRHIIEIRPEYVKLDRGLVSGIGGDPIRQALVAGMLHFAASIGLRIIAEGIETDTERLTLSGLGVEFGQGYLFGRPEPAVPCEALPR